MKLDPEATISHLVQDALRASTFAAHVFQIAAAGKAEQPDFNYGQRPPQRDLQPLLPPLEFRAA